jgi:mRNA interferase RelE/StbE
MSAPRWELRLAPAAREQLDRLPVSHAAAVVETLDAIACDRRGRGTRLRFELEECWSARRGPYRVVYRVDDPPTATVSVLALAHRATRPG